MGHFQGSMRLPDRGSMRVAARVLKDYQKNEDSLAYLGCTHRQDRTLLSMMVR